MSTTSLIVFPIMIPLYKKFKLDRDFAFIICLTAIGAMYWLPWGIGLIMSATMAVAAMPWGLCFIPAIFLQYIYFAYKHKKDHGTLGLPQGAIDEEVEQLEEKVNARPKLFWFYLLIFFMVIVALTYFKVPSYFVFVFASIITAMVNYPKDFGKIWTKAGLTFFNVVIMLLSICFSFSNL